jgi:hypothetical protein
MICERDDYGSGCEIRIFEVLPMSATNEKLETLSGGVNSRPKERQEAAIGDVANIASQPYELSPGELAVLKPALERAGRGEWASDDEVSGLLDNTWC